MAAGPLGQTPNRGSLLAAPLLPLHPPQGLPFSSQNQTPPKALQGTEEIHTPQLPSLALEALPTQQRVLPLGHAAEIPSDPSSGPCPSSHLVSGVTTAQDHPPGLG